MTTLVETGRFPGIVASLFLALTPISIASGDLITIVNSSFESTPLADGASTSSILGWNRLGPGSVLNPSSTQFPGGTTTHGENLLNLGAAGTIVHQDLASPLQYGTYELRFDVGNRLDQNFPNYSIDLLVNGSIMIKSLNQLPSPGDGQFSEGLIRYLVTPTNANGSIGFGGNLRLRFLANSGIGGSVAIDNLRLDYSNSVPEPGLAAGSWLGLLIGWGSMRRKRRAG